MLSENLLSRHPIISDQIEVAELKLIINELEKLAVTHKRGSVVEFGCYAGTTSLFIRRALDTLASKLDFHVYDSFAGLPEKTAPDSSPAGTQFQAGKLAVSKQSFVNNFRKSSLSVPYIHKGWFSDLTPDQIPDNIVLAFLDGDYYESIRDSLRLISPKLVQGSVVIVDDYQSEALPGARKAVDEWLHNKDYAFKATHSLAIINIR